MKCLAESLNMNRCRILAFRKKPSTPTDTISNKCSSFKQSKPVKVKYRRYIPQFKSLKCCFIWLRISKKTLDAPDLQDDYYLILLDWGSSNVIAIALAYTMYLWDATDGFDDSGQEYAYSWTYTRNQYTQPFAHVLWLSTTIMVDEPTPRLKVIFSFDVCDQRPGKVCEDESASSDEGFYMVVSKLLIDALAKNNDPASNGRALDILQTIS
ncbi:hypothetical protein R6Q59_036346 [Mikania micrantha]